MRQRYLAVVIALLLPVMAVAQVWTEQTIDGDYPGARSVLPADVDGDGDIDVLGAAAFADSIVWWENVDGDGLNWTEHVIDSGNSGALSVFAIDMDNDNDMDIITSGRVDNQIVWWENLNGDGLTWVEHLVGENFVLAFSVIASDIDGDGDYDVVGASYETDDVYWWEDDNGDGLTWTVHVVDAEFGGAHSIYAIDVDGDTDIDIVGAGNLADEITWWENVDGIGLNWSEHTISIGFDGAHSVFATDVDGDGNIDVLAAASFGHMIKWWKNVDGSGLTWIENSIVEGFLGASSVYATDMDDDGDVDVLGSARIDNDVIWWENINGDGMSWEEHQVDMNFSSARDVCAADVDGDLDIDILGAAHDANDITWWEQQPSPIVVTMTPTSSVELPAEGGTLAFDVNVVSNVPATYPNARAWTKLKLPNGNFYPPVLFQMQLPLFPYMDVTGSLTQDIPSYAPDGEYEMWAWVGSSPFSGPSFGNYFPFSKSLITSAFDHIDNWNADGYFYPNGVAEDHTMPAVYQMEQAYPNPFNPNTAINLSLPHRAELMVVVYNVAGQQVAELANGLYEPGNHKLNFNASNLASGVYFVRATVTGKLDQVQKVMLVR